MSADRPTLLLLPGLLNDAELWHAQRAALAGIADCVVGDLTRADSMRALASQLLEHMPPRFALAGFSLGGYVAQELLRLAPSGWSGWPCWIPPRAEMHPSGWRNGVRRKPACAPAARSMGSANA